jgi:hypothetical protein
MSISADTFRVGCDNRTYILGRQKMKHAELSIVQVLEKIKYIECKLRRKWTYSECYETYHDIYSKSELKDLQTTCCIMT